MSSHESGEKMVRAKVSLPRELDAEIEDDLEYGDYKSEWIRDACRMRIEGESDDDTTNK